MPIANTYEPTVLYKRAGVYFIANIRYQMLKKNKNFIAIIVGKSGCLDQNTEIKLWKNQKIIYKKLKDCPKFVDVPSYNFQTKKVTNQMAQVSLSGIKPCYKITFGDGSYVVASEDHIFFKHKGKPITVKELRDHYWNPRKKGQGEKERIMLATKNFLANENGFYGKRISKIEYVGDRQTYDVSVLGNVPTFFLRSGLVSHNSGKSTIALSLASLIDPSFDIRKVCFSGKEYVNILKTVKPCEAIVWDETGVGLGSRDAMTKVSKNLSKVFQTMRFKRNAIILTVPDLNMVDKTARTMIHVVIETKKIISSYGLAICRILSFNRDIFFDRPTAQYPVIRIGNELIKIKEFAVKKPDAQLMAQYEAKKEAFFQSDVLDKFDEDYSMEELKAESKIMEDKEKQHLIDDVMRKVIDNPRLFGKIRYDGWSFSLSRIKAGFGVKTEIAGEIKSKLEMNEVLRLQASGKVEK